MAQLVLKKEIGELIQNNGILFGEVADALGVKPVSLPKLLYSNDAKLTQAGVLEVILKHLKEDKDNSQFFTMQDLYTELHQTIPA